MYPFLPKTEKKNYFQGDNHYSSLKHGATGGPKYYSEGNGKRHPLIKYCSQADRHTNIHIKKPLNTNSYAYLLNLS